MKVEDLNHIHTPAELRELNEKLVVQLENANSSDYAELNLLLAQRDSLINTYLEVLQLTFPQRQFGASTNTLPKRFFGSYNIII